MKNIKKYFYCVHMYRRNAGEIRYKLMKYIHVLVRDINVSLIVVKRNSKAIENRR